MEVHLKVKKYRTIIDTALAKIQFLTEEIEKEEKALEKTKEVATGIEEAQSIVQQVAKSLQERAHTRINSIVSLCLNAVFDEPYEFKLRFDRKRGKTEARMMFVRNGIELDDPPNQVGGGVIDVAGLALRLACLLLSYPPKRRLVVLDEPFRFLRGSEYRKRTRRMLQLLSQDKGFQFIVNSDIQEYRLGKVIEIGS
jgi:hypothetical protein